MMYIYIYIYIYLRFSGSSGFAVKNQNTISKVVVSVSRAALRSGALKAYLPESSSS